MFVIFLETEGPFLFTHKLQVITRRSLGQHPAFSPMGGRQAI